MFRLPFAALLLAVVLPGIASAEPICGGVDQPNCTYLPATFMGPASSCKAYSSDAFLDLRNGGECWSCPKDFVRSLQPVTDAAACMQPLNGLGYKEATFLKKSDCPAGSFLDLRNGGECWSCPEGSTRTANKVSEWNACVAQEEYKTATKYALATGALKTTCPAGQFWDPNGYCWSCPTDFKRSVYPVTGDRACFKTGVTQLYATLIQRRCEEGSFWDMRQGGECWSCPAGFIRSALPVTDAKACVTTAAKIAVAKYEGKWACPQGQVWDPKLVPNGEGQQVASCWSCPDQSKRSVFAVDSPKACASDTFRWNTPAYREPGIFGLAAVASSQPVATLMATHWADPNVVKGFTAYLYGYYAGKGFVGSGLDSNVATEWQRIVQDPGSSDALKAYLFMYLTTVAGGTNLTNAEKDFVLAWEKYVRDRRIYIAQDARDAYTAWKAADDWARQRKSDLMGGTLAMDFLFDYGRVPPKFAENAETSLKTAWMGSAGSGAALQLLTTPMLLKPVMQRMLPFAGRGGFAPAAGIGPQVIIMIAVILGEIAIKQANEINTMDARLTSTMELASRAFSLATRLAETNGMEQQMAQWAIATAPATPIGFVPQTFVQAATRARTVAVNAGYWSAELKAAVAAP